MSQRRRMSVAIGDIGSYSSAPNLGSGLGPSPMEAALEVRSLLRAKTLLSVSRFRSCTDNV